MKHKYCLIINIRNKISSLSPSLLMPDTYWCEIFLSCCESETKTFHRLPSANSPLQWRIIPYNPRCVILQFRIYCPILDSKWMVKWYHFWKGNTKTNSSIPKIEFDFLKKILYKVSTRWWNGVKQRNEVRMCSRVVLIPLVGNVK